MCIVKVMIIPFYLNSTLKSVNGKNIILFSEYEINGIYILI